MNDSFDNPHVHSPIISMRGERVGLGPFRRELIPALHRWFNNMPTDRTQGDLPGPRTLERVTAWYDRIAAGNGERVCFAIYELASDTAIGMVWLSDIDYRHRTASFGISIGDEAVRGRGYGTETTRLILDYAFRALGLRNVMLEVYSNNPAGLRAYEKAGFRIIGRRRASYRLGSQVHDEIMMEAVATR
jgi:diamine N-acetyltransferase